MIQRISRGCKQNVYYFRWPYCQAMVLWHGSGKWSNPFCLSAKNETCTAWHRSNDETNLTPFQIDPSVCIKVFEIWDDGRFLNLLQLMLQKHDDAIFSVAVSLMRHGFGMSFYLFFFCPKSQRHSEHLKINVIEFAWKVLRSKLNQTNKINLESACCYHRFPQDWCTSKWLTNRYIHDHLEKRSTIPQCYPCLKAILA